MKATTHLVQSFVELGELSSLGHDGLVHEEGRLNLLEALSAEVIESIGDHGLVEINTIASEVKTTVTSNLGSYSAQREEGEKESSAVSSRSSLTQTQWRSTHLAPSQGCPACTSLRGGRGCSQS